MPVGIDDPLIPLKDGFAIPASVYAWLVDASFRLDFSLDGDALVVKPKAAITAEDDRVLRAHRDALKAAVRYYDGLPPC